MTILFTQLLYRPSLMQQSPDSRSALLVDEANKAIKQQNLRLSELKKSSATPTVQFSDLSVPGNSQGNSQIRKL